MSRSKSESRSVKVNRVAKKLAKRYHKQRDKKGWTHKPLARHERRGKKIKIIAYDLETTRIAVGSPTPLYITAFCDDWQCSMPINSIPHFAEILESRFLIPEFKNARFVAWNGNNFDVYFVAVALLHTNRYLLKPYLTAGKNLRGLRVVSLENKKIAWEFLDGIAMTVTSSAGMPLKSNPDEPDKKSFLKTFAPEFDEYDFRPDFSKVEFDYRNRLHKTYAERDSEGLYHGLMKAQAIVQEHFGLGLQPTLGNLGIKIFQAHMPANITVWEPRLCVTEILRNQVMRGGFCHRQRQYKGPVWKYDINQAYAAAMRDANLPAGSCQHTAFFHPWARAAIYHIKAINIRNKIPFYYRDMAGVSKVGIERIEETWITSGELEQLKAENWKIELMEGYIWDEVFRMKEYVDKLENLRITAEDGPNGAQGSMMKYIGNSSYGKTCEELDGLELVLANEKPEGYHDYNDENDFLRHVFFKFGKPMLREYHQPQLGAFITAHVRMVVRRAILKAPGAWLYADTDCVIFDHPVVLPVDPKKYGFWKVEAEASPHIIITKKVYASLDGKTKHAKGMNVKYLQMQDFEAWLNGRSPEQTQVHKQNFIKVMSGAEMFIERTKVGQRINLTSYKKAA